MSKPYCGSNKEAPKNTHLGTESECIKAKQVRRYGIKEVNPELLALSKINPEKERKKLFGIKGKIKRIDDELEYNLIQLKRDKVSKEEKDKIKEINKVFKNELKELKSKEREQITLLKGVKNEVKEKKESEDLELTKENIKLLLVRYRTRVLRLNKELDVKPNDKQLLKEKQEAIDKYNKYKKLNV